MPRLRGPAVTLPRGADAWPLLNEHLFGGNQIGGHNVVPRPEVLPVDWSAIYGRAAPLHLEIGYNRGKFLVALARQLPGANVVGIEIRRRYCWRLANMLGPDPQAPRNLRFIWADARATSRVLFGAASLTGVYINFPDPWWKKRHAKRRLVNVGFARELADMLVPGGRIWVKSDVPAIADEFAEAFAAVADLSSPEAFAGGTLPPTHRELSCMAQGLPIVRYHVTRG